MLKRLGRSETIQRLAGTAIAGWLKFVHRTSRIAFVDDNGGGLERYETLGPHILTTWHGHHFLGTLTMPEPSRYKLLISKSQDGAINAVIAEKLGAGLVRGSGATPAKSRKKGGARALLGLIEALDDGFNVALTADVPRIGGIAGLGIVTLAKFSGRPIVPAALASRHAITLSSWDRASIELPFSRAVVRIGDPILVPGDADEAMLEAKRLDVERSLDRLFADAYGRFGRRFQSARR